MKTKKAIKILKKHNAWRRGDDNLKMQHPTKLGKAIDKAIELLEKKKENQIAGFPEEVIEKMLDYQEEQNGFRKKSVFKNNIFGGFVWRSTPECHSFWHQVIVNKNFELFFEKYPKKTTEKTE